VKAIAIAIVVAACGARDRDRARFVDRIAPASLVGEWHWIHHTDEAGTRRVEEERWQFVAPAASTITGRYVREVVVTSTGDTPFECNQSTSYTQRAAFDVVVETAAGGPIVRETAYRVEPSPCDHGFRKLATYRATVGDTTATLRWDSGEATLLRTGPAPAALAEPAWPGDNPRADGAWTWRATWTEARGPVIHGEEDWELDVAETGAITGTVNRRIETRDPSGATIACAGADRWVLGERIAIDGSRDGDTFRLFEVGVEVVPHPCIARAGSRVHDAATATLIGDHLVIEWRGKRRQVLRRQLR
jgi:hypothetical protein